jgi:hypothetical protein
MNTTTQAPKIVYKDRVIGPSHDPYSAMTISVTVGNRSVEYYSDGLGTNWYELHEAGMLLRREEWHDGWCERSMRVARAAKTKGNILARRLVGMTFDEAITEAFEQYRPQFAADLRHWE